MWRDELSDTALSVLPPLVVGTLAVRLIFVHPAFWVYLVGLAITEPCSEPCGACLPGIALASTPHHDETERAKRRAMLASARVLRPQRPYRRGGMAREHRS